MKHDALQASDLDDFKSRIPLFATRTCLGWVMIVPYLPDKIDLSSTHRDGVDSSFRINLQPIVIERTDRCNDCNKKFVALKTVMNFAFVLCLRRPWS